MAGAGEWLAQREAEMTAVWPAVGAIVGLAIGSFVGTLAKRWSGGQSIGGRSACDGCGRKLTPAELVPVLSYLALRGRCRTCRSAIDPSFPTIEATAAAIGAVTFGLSPGWEGFAGAIFGWTLLALALLDLARFWLPNRLTLPLLTGGLVAGAAGLGPSLDERVIGAALGYASLATLAVVYLRVRRRHGLGRGDAKLFAAIGACLGWEALPAVLVGAATLGLTVVLVRVLRGDTVAAEDRLPFGTMLAAAGFSGWVFAAVQRCPDMYRC